MPNNTWSLLTPPNMGAIAIIQIAGDVQPVLCKLTNRSTWEHGNLYLVNIEGIDEVIAVQIDDRLAQVMPHGGVHILRKLAERFEELDVAKNSPSKRDFLIDLFIDFFRLGLHP